MAGQVRIPEIAETDSRSSRQAQASDQPVEGGRFNAIQAGIRPQGTEPGQGATQAAAQVQ
ncbi:MAG: hypothetical protein COW48_10020 [Hydrogenophilales bacterium CG17_big_fil_post_rev_8_21_14_2_50_63_12]|nr:MAG: hypothetical protein COW48_10020 [Hydrogenophilales bacterium CG17_big_fil_post_rev_8_21_14_2_50_63_12]